MSELIEKGDVLGVISCFFKDNYIEDADWHLADLEREINRLDAASPWHRVEDELPKKNIQCLVRDNDNNYAVGYYRQDARAWDSPFFGWVERDDEYYEDGDLCRIGKVVAWMPIEPPKEDA